VLNPDFVEAVRRLHPQASLRSDVVIVDRQDGNGPQLVAWNLPGDPPTDDEIAAAMARPPVTALSYQQFRALFTAAENAAIMTAAQTNHAVLDWVLQAVGAAALDLADAAMKAGLEALVAAGLLTAERETQVLANQPPPAS